MIPRAAREVPLAGRLAALGGDTPYAVFEAAAALAARGVTVYPFHLGDLNLPTPPPIVEAAHRAMREGKTGYAPAAGIMLLREAVTDEAARLHGVPYSPENVVVQSGGSQVILKFVQAVTSPADEILYPTPGFPIYELAIELFGGVARPYRIVESGERFAIDLDHLRAQISPNTRALILNNCHNPTAAECTRSEVEWLAELVSRHDLLVLADDAYAEIRYTGQTHFLQSVPGMAARTVTLYTFSKKYAMTGWRLGAAVGPPALMDVFTTLSAAESGTANFTQWAGLEALRGDQSGAVALLATLKERRAATLEALAGMDGVRAHVPESTIYVYPEVAGALRRLGLRDVREFAAAALRETGVSFCTRRHFGRLLPAEDDSYIRLAYSGIDTAGIREGLGRLRAWIQAG
ncbi:MAG: pyridoxal phosphate-dependent aminotransferase [Candidatus Methylomirabilaceae bacterium]